MESATEIGFVWSPQLVGWERPGLPILSNIDGPIQHFRSAVLESWRGEVSADLVGHTLTTFGRDKALLRSILVGGVWNGFSASEG